MQQKSEYTHVDYSRRNTDLDKHYFVTFSLGIKNDSSGKLLFPRKLDRFLGHTCKQAILDPYIASIKLVRLSVVTLVIRPI